jgi:oligoribonuclease NrnB/cAMP/cGMP phosphodiesterase (DHH superfamily)
MKTLFHTDADGWCAAYWVRKRFNNTNPEDFIMIDYGMDTDWFSKIQKDEKVIIVDFSLEPDMMRKLLKKTKDIIWIDHHISAIEKYKDFDEDIAGLRYNGIAASVLTYCYFFEMKDGKISFDPETMPQKAPWFTKYIGDHDVWKYEFGEETAHFKLGLDALGVMLPTDSIWEKLYNLDKVKEIINNGTIIEKYRDAMGKKSSELYGFEWKFDGYKAFCLNNCFGGSEWFGDLIKKYDLVCAFLYIGENDSWEYSLYTDKDHVDVSKIAENYPDKLSGGGHKKAAGIQSKNFMFNKRG